MAPPPTQQPYDTRVIDLPEGKGRILCIADIRGDIDQLNRLVKETEAVACIHTGDFGFFEPASLDRIVDKTLKHLITYSPTISPSLRNRLLLPSTQRSNSLALLAPSDTQFHLSQFPQLLGGSPKLKLLVPTFVVYGACEDVRIVEKFRTNEYQVENLTILDEATTRVLEVGGVRLRLFGLGGAVVMAKMFDNGEGKATIAGGGGTMWTTALQIGELVDTAQRVYDPSETRLFITHSSMGREPILCLLSIALKADLTISGGLHFRYGASFNEFSVQDEGGGSWWSKVQRGKAGFMAVYEQVQSQVEEVIDSDQKIFLEKALTVINRAPPSTGTGPGAEEASWKNTWSWNLTDSTYGHLLLDIKEGRVSAELKSQGFNFAHRKASQSSSFSPSTKVLTNSSTSSSTAGPTNPHSFTGSKGTKPLSTTFNASSQSTSATTNNNSHGGDKQPSSLSAGASPLSTPAPPPPSAKPSGLKEVPNPSPLSPTEPSPSTEQPPASPLSTPAGEASSNGLPPAYKNRNPHSLYISQMIPPVTEPELKEFFGKAAEGVVSVKFILDKETGAQRHFAYVGFADAAAMELGLSSHAPTLKNATPNVAISKPPSSGDFSSFGRGRGRGRGGRGDYVGNLRGGRGRMSSFSAGSGRTGEEGPAPAAAAVQAGGEKKVEW